MIINKFISITFSVKFLINRVIYEFQFERPSVDRIGHPPDYLFLLPEKDSITVVFFELNAISNLASFVHFIPNAIEFQSKKIND